MPDQSYYVMLNANSGTVLAMGLTAASLQAMFEARGLKAIIDADEGSFTDRIERAMASDAEIIVAAGGDGTITALAEAIVDSPKSLAMLPLGTVNALAKDLNIPLEIEAAMDALATGVPQRIDVGDVNGRIFLHKVVVGLIPGMAAGREHVRGMPGVMPKLGLLRYFLRRVIRARSMAVAIEADDGGVRVGRVKALAVASNAYDEGFGRLLARERLDRGTLTLYTIRRLGLTDIARLATGMIVGRWRQDDALSMESVKKVTITSHRDLVKVMFDGEVISLHTPLQFKVRPLALTVIAPPPVSVESAEPVAQDIAS